MSRRFKGRLERAIADPGAKPEAAVVLDDSNSYADPLQPDVRKPFDLNARRYAKATAGSDEGDAAHQNEPVIDVEESQTAAA